MSQPMGQQWHEYQACAECDSEEPIACKRAGDESFFYCEACESIEGRIRTLFRNSDTDEVISLKEYDRRAAAGNP